MHESLRGRAERLQDAGWRPDLIHGLIEEARSKDEPAAWLERVLNRDPAASRLLFKVLKTTQAQAEINEAFRRREEEVETRRAEYRAQEQGKEEELARARDQALKLLKQLQAAGVTDRNLPQAKELAAALGELLWQPDFAGPEEQNPGWAWRHFTFSAQGRLRLGRKAVEDILARRRCTTDKSIPWELVSLVLQAIQACLAKKEEL